MGYGSEGPVISDGPLPVDKNTGASSSLACQLGGWGAGCVRSG
ncbi:unnamed protein product [Ectocarpus sp. CCAP 1310/34]|nr:unnamed protein product [Ectocarpus sp. CCAP 1310/34]